MKITVRHLKIMNVNLKINTCEMIIIICILLYTFFMPVQDFRTTRYNKYICLTVSGETSGLLLCKCQDQIDLTQ